MREVLRMVEKVAGMKLDVAEGPRRAGDPPELIARAERIREQLGWQPAHDDLEPHRSHRARLGTPPAA